MVSSRETIAGLAGRALSRARHTAWNSCQLPVTLRAIPDPHQRQRAAAPQAVQEEQRLSQWAAAVERAQRKADSAGATGFPVPAADYLQLAGVAGALLDQLRQRWAAAAAAARRPPCAAGAVTRWIGARLWQRWRQEARLAESPAPPWPRPPAAAAAPGAHTPGGHSSCPSAHLPAHLPACLQPARGAAAAQGAARRPGAGWQRQRQLRGRGG
jgi:hypothetical protein